MAERLKPESLFDRFVAYREGLGMEVLALTGGERSAVSVLTERLQAGGGVCLVADRDLSGQGIEVEFFGETARMPAGPAMLAATTGAALLPVGMWFTDDGWGLRDRAADRARRHAPAAIGCARRPRRWPSRSPPLIAAHPADWHMLQRFWAADLRRAEARLMRIGLVCPYSWDIPGGVQAHVRDLAETFIAQGHSVSVLAPGDDDEPGLPPYVVTSGKAVPLPYNGSVARVQFGLVSASRVRRWLRDGGFDVVHVHEPAAASLSLLACMMYDGPLVATFHIALTHSRFLAMFDNVLQPFLEKISGRIAVSAAARKVIVEHLGGDAVVIPNGVAVARYAERRTAAGLPAPGRHDRLHRPLRRAPQGHGRAGRRAGRAGRAPARAAAARRRSRRGRGVPGRAAARRSAGRIDLLGQVSEDDKARMLRSVDIYCAPNTGQESFGIILLEALAAGTPIVASDLDAFKQVLRGGAVGRLFPVGDPHALARRDRASCSRRAAARRRSPRAGAAGRRPVRLAGDRRPGHARVRGRAVAGTAARTGRRLR